MNKIVYKGTEYVLVSVRQMRNSDAHEIATRTPSETLMWRAGEGIFRLASWKAPVAIVCGEGNNAGDGYVVACCLQNAGIPCELILLGDRFSQDGLRYYTMAKSLGVPEQRYQSGNSFSAYGSILDCLFGTGFHGDVTGLYAEAIRAINASGAYVVSADINSGLNGDTGLGTTYVRSDLTVSIGSFKTGHFCGLADEAMKDKINLDIGIPILP